MPWYTITDAANIRRVTKRQIYRLIDRNKIKVENTAEGTLVWLDDPVELTVSTPMDQHISIPYVSPAKITPAVLAKVDALHRSIGVLPGMIDATEREIASQVGVSVASQQAYKRELRQIFNLPPRTPLHTIAGHGQIRQALEYVIIPRSRSDRNTLRVGRDLTVIVSSAGEGITIQEFLEGIHANEFKSAADAYVALLGRCLQKEVLRPDGTLATKDDLPSERSVREYLRKWRAENAFARRARSTKSAFEAKELPYMDRDLGKILPGEMWLADHTELDFVVYNEDGKPSRRWITAFIDQKSTLIVGYVLCWQPNSDTIALAFRNAVTSAQIFARVADEPSGYKHIILGSIPNEITFDNGKDFRSNISAARLARLTSLTASESQRKGSPSYIIQCRITGNRKRKSKDGLASYKTSAGRFPATKAIVTKISLTR